MSENECFATRPAPQPVGMGSHAMDSHHFQRNVTEGGQVQNGGDIGIKPRTPLLEVLCHPSAS